MNPSSQYHLKASLATLFLIMLILCISCNETDIAVHKSSNSNSFNRKDLELPNTSVDLINHHNGFKLQYSELHEQPLWVAYLLTRTEIYCTTSRTDDFRADSTIFSGSATNEDYDNSGYVRGHLKPAADSRFSKDEMSASFLLSNISPMTWEFNEGIWLNLEKRIRDLTIVYDSLFIITGPILTDSLSKIGENGVSVPKFFYKAFIEVTGEEYHSEAYIIPSDSSNSEISNFKISIDSLENILELDLFYNLPDSLEADLEN